jgi:GNAT superfamily N-acetyltransferase
MIRIVPLDEAGGPDRWRAEIEAIFFANAATSSFASDEARDAYRDLWLGRYLRHTAEACFVALDVSNSRHPGNAGGVVRGPVLNDPAGSRTAASAASGVTKDPTDAPEASAVLGYLAGTLFSDREPLPGPDYYALFPPGLIAAFPAHVHVNVHEKTRGQRIGSALIGAFRALCVQRQVPGMHAVTTAESRAAQFFISCGMSEQAQANWRGRHIVFLGEFFAA